MIINQVQACIDATDNEGLEDIRSTLTINSDVDQQKIYDIQHAVARLVWKAPQLIGMTNNLSLNIFDITCNLLGNFTTNLTESWMHILPSMQKIRHICTNYTCSENGSFFSHCL